MPQRSLTPQQKAALVKCARSNYGTAKVHKATGQALDARGYGTYTERKGLFYANWHGMHFGRTGEQRKD